MNKTLGNSAGEKTPTESRSFFVGGSGFFDFKACFRSVRADQYNDSASGRTACAVRSGSVVSGNWMGSVLAKGTATRDRNRETVLLGLAVKHC